MTDKPIPSFAIHRNNDGTWVEDWHLKHGTMKSKPDERNNAPLAR
jgi:hypothetical protein